MITHLKTCVGTLSLVRVCNMGCLADEPAQHSEGFVEQLTGALVLFFLYSVFCCTIDGNISSAMGCLCCNGSPFVSIFLELCVQALCAKLAE